MANNIRYSERCKKIIKLTSIFAEVCGANVIKDNFYMSWLTWSVVFLINLAFLFSFYTMYLGVSYNNDWTEILKCICMLSSGIQGYSKLINGIKKRDQYRFLFEEVIKMYTVYELKHENYQNKLRNTIFLIKTLIFSVSGIYVFAALFLIGVPAFYWIFLNQRVFIMQFLVPYIDASTDIGFKLTFAIHVVCILFGCFGNFVSDSWCFIFVGHIPCFKNILQCKFDDLDGVLKTFPRDFEKEKRLLRDIFQWHQKYIDFCNTTKSTFFWIIFVQVATAFFGIACTTVCIFLHVWPAAPVYLIYSFVILYAYCGLGNLVEIANDDITSIIYNSNWYLLTIPEQKMILIMLGESQKDNAILIGGIAPLSMNTALQLTKTIYSVAMMFNEFLD